MLAIIALGFRKYDGGKRMVATNSKAISAACHPPAEDQSQGHLLPVRWGVVELDENNRGHCTLQRRQNRGRR
ncbi:hypothetical protein LY76DRAFT_593104 [Colletotrichum caudatum]|nr:hypothetical protein LY76DRAFT_593104 [Colletotrichum caudatum]